MAALVQRSERDALAVMRNAHGARTARPRHHRTNDAAFLKRLPTEKVLAIAVAQSPDPFPATWEGETGSFTIEWIRHHDQGAAIIEDLLKERFQSERARLKTYLDVIEGVPGDGRRKAEIRGLVEIEARNTPGVPPLSGPEHDALIGQARSNVVQSLTNFKEACGALKDELRAQAAEDQELFAFVMEIAFSFGLAGVGVDLGSYVGKKLEHLVEAKKITKGFAEGLKEMHLDEKALEAFGKWGQRRLKEGAGPTKPAKEAEGAGKAESGDFEHESADDRFTKELSARQGEITADLESRLGEMTDVEIAQVVAAYDPAEVLTEGHYEAELKQKLAEHKRMLRVGGLGSTTEDLPHDYKRYFGSEDVARIDGKLAYVLNAKQGYSNDGPVIFRDWVPRDEWHAATERSKKEFLRTTIRRFRAGDVKVFAADRAKFGGGS